jgi:hypothetical protein
MLMPRGVVEELSYLPESDGFLRGLVALVGFKQVCVAYARAARSSVALSGEYIGRIYDEVKAWHISLIDEAVNVTVLSRRGPDSCSV